MASPGLTRQIQQDFSGGMFRNGPAELIPANGLFDATNALLRTTGGLFKRGGGSYRATAFGAGLRFIWDGWLSAGQTTLVASTSAFGKLAGGAVTSLGGAGMAVAGRPAVYEGRIYLPGGFTYDGTTVGAAAKTSAYYAVVANRLLAAEGSKVLFSKIGTPGTFEATDFHTLPGGIEILGLEGLRSSAAVFTTDGVWIIGGLAKNLTDGAGNVQQTLDLYSRELVLWGNGGIASWEGALVVPGTEGVYLLSLGVTSEKAQSFVRLSDPIVDLYQEYVRSGYSPGQATVFRNHYFLPIIGGGDVVDLLVCRLDMPMKDGRSRPWTHFAGAGAKVAALTTRVVTGFSRTPELLGALYSASQSRPVTLAYFTPSANTEHDQDGSTPQWSLTTRGFTTGGLVPNLVARVRARYQLMGSSSPTISAQVATESDVPPQGASMWGGFVWSTTKAGAWASPGGETFEAMGAGEAPASPDGAKPFSWHPRRKRRFVRFRLSSSSPTSLLALRSLEIFIRPEGRI